MSEKVIVRHRDEGKTVLVGGADYVTYKVRSAETDGTFFCFEASSSPGFGPPLHSHAYRELFYVLEGQYEFTVGLPTHISAPKCSSIPPRKLRAISDSCAGPSGSWNTLTPSSSTSVKWWWCPFADTPVNGFGIHVGSTPCLRPTAAATWR